MTGAPATVDKLIIIGKVLVRLPNGVEEKMMRSGRRKTPRVGESVRVSSHGEISPQMEILAEKIQVAARRRIYVKCGPKTLQPGHTGFRFKETEKERWLVITLEGDNNYDVKGLSGISENELAELKEILVSQGVPEMEEKNHMQVEPITVSVAPPVANRTAEKLVEPDQNLPDRSEEDLRLGFLIAVGEHGELQDDGRYLSKKTLVKAIPYCFEINANSSHQLYMSAIGRINWMLDRWPDIEIEKKDNLTWLIRVSDEALALIKPKQAVPSSVDEPSQRVIDTIADGLTKTQIATPVANDEPPAVPTLEKPEKRDEQCDLLEELRQRPFAELQQMREQLTEPQRDLLRYLLE